MKNVVFVHGFMGSALNWGPVLTALRRSDLKDRYKFHAVDLLGHGGRRSSPLGEYETLTLDWVSRDLFEQTKALGPIVAVGHSFGFRPLLRLSKLHPELISEMIVEDSSPQVDLNNYTFLKSILETTPAFFRSRDEALAFFQEKYPGKLGAFLLSNIRQDPSDTSKYSWRFDAQGLQEVLDDSFQNPQWTEWENFRGRAYILRGQNSDFLTSERMSEMLSRRSVPTHHTEIANAGHWIHSDQVDMFAKIMVQILSSWDAEN
jgi:esterase